MADRDPTEHMVFISRGEGEGRIKRKIRISQINTVMFSVSSEIIVLRSFLAFGQAHAILVCFPRTLLQLEKHYSFGGGIENIGKSYFAVKKVSSSWIIIIIITTRKAH